MLTLTLRGLERDGLVKRTQFPTIPPRVDYELTELGRSLWEAVKPLAQWAQSHVKHIARARAAFDKKNNAQPVADISSEQRIGQASET
jgi:DNA-binding HxlR family transcriptional regulator